MSEDELDRLEIASSFSQPFTATPTTAKRVKEERETMEVVL
jgi:hypothetical protein